MGPDTILAQQLKNQKLTVGQEVLAHWHNSHGNFSARAVVVVLKQQRAVVELRREAGHCRAGTRLDLPRISDLEHWTHDYGIELGLCG